MEAKIKGVLWGTSVIIGVILLNWIILSVLNFPMMAMDLISNYWYLFVLLIGGFGFQVGLFVYFHSLSSITCGMTVASGGISAVSMVLCCSHYLLNLLPFLGALVGVSFFSALSGYTIQLLTLGIVSNVIGVSVLFYQRNKYSRKKKK
jgi:hypothetical protein